jgi:hypothetical protein
MQLRKTHVPFTFILPEDTRDLLRAIQAARAAELRKESAGELHRVSAAGTMRWLIEAEAARRGLTPSGGQ